MPVRRCRFGLRHAIASALTVSLIALSPITLSAQMGGMRGGGMGGRSGGMGGRGGGTGGRGGGIKSPAAMARERLNHADPIEFLLDRKKPLELSKPQEHSLQSLRTEMQHIQEPLFKDLDRLFGEMPQGGGRRGGAPPGGGMGGRGRGDGRPGDGRPGDDPPAGGAPGGGAPDTVRAVIGRISDIQDSFRDRAREQLDPVQRTRADSLQQVMLAEERAKFEKQREKRGERR